MPRLRIMHVISAQHPLYVSAIWQACYRCPPGGGQAGINSAQPGVMRRGSPVRQAALQTSACAQTKLRAAPPRRCRPDEPTARSWAGCQAPAQAQRAVWAPELGRAAVWPPARLPSRLPALQVLLQDGQALGLLAVVSDHGAGALDDLHTRVERRHGRSAGHVMGRCVLADTCLVATPAHGV